VLRCPKGFTASVAPGTSFRIARGIDGKIGIELESGSAFFRNQGTDGFTLLSDGGAVVLEPRFPRYDGTIRIVNGTQVVTLISGDFAISYPLETHGRTVKLHLVGAIGELRGKRIDAGQIVSFKGGDIATDHQSREPEAPSYVKKLFEENVRPSVLVNLNYAKNRAPARAGTIPVNATVTSVVANGKCELHGYRRNLPTPVTKTPIHANGTAAVDVPGDATLQFVPVCWNEETKVYGSPGSVIGR
jgi:hypothetical protein